MVCGEAGVGKTALLDYVVEHASGLPGRPRRRRPVGDGARVRRAAPVVRTDAGSPRPAAGTAARRAADRVRPRRGAAPDRFLVGLAVLSLLSRPAEERPLRLRGGRRAVARPRLGAGPRVRRAPAGGGIGRPGLRRSASRATTWPGCRSWRSAGLAEGDARALLDAVADRAAGRRVRDRIVAETRGNPLALLELPRGLTPAELAGGFALPGRDAAVRAGSRQSFRRRLEPLPADTPAAAAARGGRAGRRSGAGVAGRRATRDRRCGGDAGGRRRPDRVRRPGAVPASAGALGGLPVGRRCRSAQAVHRALAEVDRSDRGSRPPRLASGPGHARTRRGRSPPSWSARPAGRRPVAAWPRRPRSWSGRRS